MDIETGEAIDGLRTDLRDVEVRLSTRIDGLRTELRAEMAHMRAELRSEFRDGLAENRRHADVLVEAVRDDIRMVAEGVAALTGKVEALGGRGR